MARISPHDPVAREVARRIRARQVRRRRMVLLAVVLGIIALVVIIVATRPGGGRTTSTVAGGVGTTAPGSATTGTLSAAMYAATLTGSDQIPPVDTNSTGQLRLTVDPASSSVSFVLEVDGLTNTSTAHIYAGEPGQTGEVVVTLFEGPTIAGPHTGSVAEGSITDADLTGMLAGKTLVDLVQLIQSGSAYVSVGNTSYPDGAIRGQLE